VVLRLLLGIAFLATLTGCATTGGVKNSQEQMQARVTELEKKVEEKDSEIVDLQYQVKDLSSKVGSKESTDSGSDEVVAVKSSSKASSNFGTDDIIRVNASVADVQTALKAAGNYTGKIDGKLGSGTKQAIVEFQRAHHLAADGVLGKKTWKLLKASVKE